MPVDTNIFEKLVAGVKDYAVFVLDPEGCVQTWNAGAQQLKGYAPEEIIGKHFSIFYTPQAVDICWPQKELEIAGREGRLEDEGWRVRKDGSRFWANVVITAIRENDGRLLGFSKITRDLSSRKRAEETLRQSEERFRLLVEGVQDYAIYMLDENGMVTSWNSGAQNIKGYTRDEVLGKHFSLFYLPEDIRAGKPWEGLARARNSGHWEDEAWRVRKNGERFWARVVVSALYDAEGHLRGFAKVTQDLTQREQTRELHGAAQRVHEFVAMLAHELRNPLAPIRTALQIMERTPFADPVHAAMHATIKRQSDHLMRIVDDMLDIARVTRGALSIERRTLDLSDVVTRGAEMVRPIIEEAKQKLEIHLPTAPLQVNGDVSRLTQVVANLLTNAARFTPGGGRISVTAWQEGGMAVLRVADNGRGISPDDLRTIFGMFIQGKEPLHRVGGGLGIGLALSRSICDLHGGTIEAKSEGEGAGSQFIVRLPSSREQIHEVQQGSAHATRSPEKIAAKRVLIVDDNLDAARTLDLLLTSLGHETSIAADGLLALQAADAFRPDVVLLDLGLPGISGYEVARRLRQTGKPMRIVAITGWGQESDRKRSQDAGFDLHLVKPVDEVELRDVVEANGRGLNTLH